MNSGTSLTYAHSLTAVIGRKANIHALSRPMILPNEARVHEAVRDRFT